MPAALVQRNADDDEVYEGSRSFLIRTPFHPGQLDAEITKAMNWKNNAGLIVEGDPATASQETPCRIWVTRGEVDEKAFEKVARDHRPKDDWAPPIDIDTLKTRVKAGEQLAPHEQTALLAHLVS